MRILVNVITQITVSTGRVATRLEEIDVIQGVSTKSYPSQIRTRVGATPQSLREIKQWQHVFEQDILIHRKLLFFHIDAVSTVTNTRDEFTVYSNLAAQHSLSSNKYAQDVASWISILVLSYHPGSDGKPSDQDPKSSIWIDVHVLSPAICMLCGAGQREANSTYGDHMI
jgi:hypothetical protein